jgi:hypothetical protein
MRVYKGPNGKGALSFLILDSLRAHLDAKQYCATWAIFWRKHQDQIRRSAANPLETPMISITLANFKGIGTRR